MGQMTVKWYHFSLAYRLSGKLKHEVKRSRFTPATDFARNWNMYDFVSTESIDFIIKSEEKINFYSLSNPLVSTLIVRVFSSNPCDKSTKKISSTEDCPQYFSKLWYQRNTLTPRISMNEIQKVSRRKFPNVASFSSSIAVIFSSDARWKRFPSLVIQRKSILIINANQSKIMSTTLSWVILCVDTWRINSVRWSPCCKFGRVFTKNL